MWPSSSVQPRLMSPLPPLPVPLPRSTVKPMTLVALLLPGNGFHDVMRQWHSQTDLNSLSSIMRVIGYLLVITTCGLQLPHIFKVLKSRNCDGISAFSTAILLHSTSANVAYCINKNLPLSTWAESLPLMAQYITLMCLLLLYSGRQRSMLVFVLLYVLLMLPLLLGVVPGHLVSSLKVLTLPLTLLGKVNQIHNTYKRGGTGTMSKVSIFLLNMRSGGRLLTSFFDTYDGVLVLCYAHACFWNTLITFQTVYYGHKKRRRMREERKRREREEATAIASLFESSSDSDSTESDSSTNRCYSRRRLRFNNFTVNNSHLS